ncbi:MAG: hypothetical protein C0518_10650 [Opitutus sp.]|nr:hypothetical protein [Opitutus sp.]
MHRRVIFIVFAIASLGAVTARCTDDRAALIEAMKQTERDFCALVVKEGGYVGFTTFMAEPSVFSGDVFPDRATARAKLPNRPRRPGVATYWEPVFGDIARSGDFGYIWGSSWVTGLTTPEGQPRNAEGFTFTVWRQQADGTWKFVLDAGGPSTPDAVAAVVAAAKSAPMDDALLAPDARGAAAGARELLALDESLGRTSEFSEAFIAAAASDAFSLDLAAYGQPQVATVLRAQPRTGASREPLHAEVASSGDLGYSFGLWHGRTAPNSAPAEGAYFTMWKRQRDGSWRWVIDNTFVATDGLLAAKLARFRTAAAALRR